DLQKHMDLDKILDYLARLDTPVSFSQSLLYEILYGLGKSLIILNRMRREAPSITPQTSEEAKKIIRSGELVTLNKQEDINDFIVFCLPYLELDMVEQILPHQNEALLANVMNWCMNTFLQLPSGEMIPLRASSLLLLYCGR